MPKIMIEIKFPTERESAETQSFWEAEGTLPLQNYLGHTTPNATASGWESAYEG